MIEQQDKRLIDLNKVRIAILDLMLAKDKSCGASKILEWLFAGDFDANGYLQATLTQKRIEKMTELGEGQKIKIKQQYKDYQEKLALDRKLLSFKNSFSEQKIYEMIEARDLEGWYATYTIIKILRLED